MVRQASPDRSAKAEILTRLAYLFGETCQTQEAEAKLTQASPPRCKLLERAACGVWVISTLWVR
jgi:hypothetical protein